MKVYLLTYDIKSDTSNGYALVTANSPTLALAILNSQGLYFGTYNIISTREVIGEGTEVFPCFRILTEGIISANTNTDIYSKKEIDALLGDKANLVHSHTINDITLLPAALDNKQDKLVSGTNIKTVNGTSLLGSGDIVIETDTYTTDEIDDALSGKQNALTSNQLAAVNSTITSGKVHSIETFVDSFYLSDLVLDETDYIVQAEASKITAAHDAMAQGKSLLIKCSSNNSLYIPTSPHLNGSVAAFSFVHMGKSYTVTIDQNDEIVTTYQDISNVQSKLTFDSKPTSGSTNPVTSGGVYTAISNKAEASSIPTNTSDLTNDGEGATTTTSGYSCTTATDKGYASGSIALKAGESIVAKGNVAGILVGNSVSGGAYYYAASDTLVKIISLTQGESNTYTISSPDPFTKKSYVDNLVSDLALQVNGKADADSVYTKTSADAQFATKDQLLTTNDNLTDVANRIPTKVSALTNDSGYLTDAPSDSNQYARKDGNWVVVEGGGGSTDAYTKAETDELLATKIEDAPSDGSEYVRKSGTWSKASAKGKYTEVSAAEEMAVDNETFPTNSIVRVSSKITITSITDIDAEVNFFVGSGISLTLPIGTAIIGAIDSSNDYVVSILNGKAVVGNFENSVTSSES